jgi:hypothetical protein
MTWDADGPNKRHGMHAGNGAQRIAMERIRQRREEGWDAEHDKGHGDELAKAGSIYAAPRRNTVPVAMPDLSGRGPEPLADIPVGWPWAPEWWKPTPDDRIRELEKAGALIAAAIDALLAEFCSNCGKPLEGHTECGEFG